MTKAFHWLTIVVPKEMPHNQDKELSVIHV